MVRRCVVRIALGVAALATFWLAAAQGAYTARLSWVPVSLAQQKDVSGQGAVTAALSGRRLSINGTFEGLPGAATVARLHQGLATGVGGPPLADLSVTNSASGTVDGTVTLDADQLAALRAGYLYIQLHAEHGVPPDNAVLRGWLLAPAASR